MIKEPTKALIVTACHESDHAVIGYLADSHPRRGAQIIIKDDGGTP